MNRLILMYHGMSTTETQLSNVHSLPMQTFVAHVEHLTRKHLPVISWKDLNSLDTTDDGTNISITFDDGLKSDLQCAQFLRSRGYDALFFIPTEQLGRPAHVSEDDVMALQALGMGIGSHSHRHVLLTSLSDEEVEHNLSLSRRILEDITGAAVHHVSFPGGAYDSRVLAIARQVGYTHLFTSDWGLNSAEQLVSGVLRRTAVLNTFDLGHFDALVRSRGDRLRRTAFKAKELAKQALGERSYSRLRLALLRLIR